MPVPASPAADDHAAWAELRRQWLIPADVTYLNHGSFGPSPRSVLDARGEWIGRLESQPMDFFLRQMLPALDQTRRRLGRLVGAGDDGLVLVENATAAMNVVAASVSLAQGDEVLANDHEYGAVLRIWQRKCEQSGARLVVQKLPCPIESAGQVADALLAGANPRHTAAGFQPRHLAHGRDLAGRADLPPRPGAEAGCVHRRPACRGHAPAEPDRPGLRLLYGQLPQVAVRPVWERVSLCPSAGPGGCGGPRVELEHGPRRAGKLAQRLHLAGHPRSLGPAGPAGGDRFSGTGGAGGLPPAHALSGPLCAQNSSSGWACGHWCPTTRNGTARW